MAEKKDQPQESPETPKARDDYKFSSSEWAFNDKVADNFPNHVRSNLPSYDRFQWLAEFVTDFYCPHDGVIVDLGCAAGETLERLGRIRPNARRIGYDNSVPMVAKANSREGVTAEHLDMRHNFEMPKETDVVLSIFTLQFTPVEGRTEILKKIYESMNVGGAFLIAEKCEADDGHHQRFLDDALVEYKLGAGLTEEEVVAKQRALRTSLLPYSEKGLWSRLTINFDRVNCIFKDLHFTAYLCRKGAH